MAEAYDIAIIGAGMAGASLAAELAGQGRIAMFEAEDRPGYHATGRSAAFWTESYGGPGVQPLTVASGPYLRDGGFLSPRCALTIGRSGQETQVQKFVAQYAALGVDVRELDRGALESWIPGLKPDWTRGALEPTCSDIDVAALHQHYLARARMGAVDLFTRARVSLVKPWGKGWQISLENGQELRCSVLVNAAGAWADTVAGMAGIRPIGIEPYRRTISQVKVSPAAPANLPLVLDIGEQFYFKPESGRIWLSPHDETPSLPCDAAAEEIDVALAIDRFEGVVDWTVEQLEHRWAGLRSFAPDRLPVFGFDPGHPGFFWFAGQGGFGIQTAPAAACLAAGLINGSKGGDIDPDRYAPDRFA